MGRQETTTRRADPSRRELLAGVAALAACARTPRWTQVPGRRFEEPIVVDIHCHTFNASDLPITGFIARTIPGLTELSHGVTQVPEQILRKVVGTIHGWLNAEAPSADAELPQLRAALASPRGTGPAIGPVPPLALPRGLLERLGDQIATLLGLDARAVHGAVSEGFVKLAETLHLVGHARAQIAASLALTYPSVALFTPLLVDYDAWSDDHAQSPLAAQVPVQELVSQLAIRGRIGRAGARFHPFVAFDPLRDGALAIVRDAVERSGFIGVKLYPPVGFLPIGNAGFSADAARGEALDRALRGLYTLCQAEEIPITAHTSPGNEFALGYGQLAAPAHWAPVLREFPNLRLNFGHFGHETGVDGASRRHDSDSDSDSDGAAADVVADLVEARHAWMRQAAELIEQHAHVYADLSSSPLVYDAAYAARFGQHMKSLCGRFRRLPSRLMYGSDWWLNRFEPGAETAVAVFERHLGEWLGAGGRDAIMGRNALRFLGLLDEDDRLAVGNRNHQRLRACYGAEPLPAWLA